MTTLGKFTDKQKAEDFLDMIRQMYNGSEHISDEHLENAAEVLGRAMSFYSEVKETEGDEEAANMMGGYLGMYMMLYASTGRPLVEFIPEEEE